MQLHNVTVRNLFDSVWALLLLCYTDNFQLPNGECICQVTFLKRRQSRLDFSGTQKGGLDSLRDYM